MVSKKKEKKKRSSPNFRAIFRPKTEIQRFFRWSPKKKKKRSSPKLRLIFRPISQIQTFEGGCFPLGEAIFNFSQKIGLKSIKNMRFCKLHQPMGGLEPPPPPLATLLGTPNVINFYLLTFTAERIAATLMARLLDWVLVYVGDLIICG